MSNGKGDRNRPKSINYKTWCENYERIFMRPSDREGKTDKYDKNKK